VIVWRLARRKHAALDGEGARLAAGRWNSWGVPVVYTSEHLSLAVLEVLVHVDSDLLPHDLIAFEIEIPDGVSHVRVDATGLPRGWRTRIDRCRRVGDAWIADGRSAVLAVPSVVIPHETNFLINPRHARSGRVRVVRSERFQLDIRLP
jgi:RES domain-containing protein